MFDVKWLIPRGFDSTGTSNLKKKKLEDKMYRTFKSFAVR